MKKILVLLLFISGLVKGQVVIPKSTTTFSNILATGNLTVNGTARITGASTLTGAVTTGTNVTVGGRMSAASLSVTAQTFSVGTTNYTAGNTGTIAVLSDAVFNTQFMTIGTSPADATTYYFGNVPFGLNTPAGTGTITIPYNCTLIGWNYDYILSGASSTSETATLSIAGTTNYTLSTSITFTTSTSGYSASGLSQNFNAGDVINAKFISPTWVTNPVGIYQGLTLWFVRRQ